MDDIYDDIKNLPDDFVENSKPSKAIKKLYEKREAAEKNALQKMEEKKHKICEKYKALISERSEELKRNIDDVKGLIKNELFDSKLRAYNDNADNLEKSSFKKVQISIQNHTKKRRDLVEEFYNNLGSIEKKQSIELTNVLKEAYEEIKKISFKLPSEYDECIELEIEKINQSILSNHRNYMELKHHLQLEIEQDCKNCTEELRHVKENWIKYLRTRTDKALGYLRNQNFKHIAQYDPEISKAADMLKKDAEEITQKIDNVRSIIKLQQAKEWLRSVRLTLGKLDHHSLKIIAAFKQAAVLVFNRFFQELKVTADELNEMIEKDEIQSIQCEMYTPTLEEIRNSYDVELEVIQRTWNDLVDQLSRTVESTYKFLLAGATLWEKHFKRTEVLQAVVLKDVDNTIIANNNQSEPYESKLNILIDSLRQEPSKDRMHKSLEDIKKLLIAMTEVYKSQFQIEVGVYKKYRATQEFKIDILLAEIKRFLVVYPPDLEKDPKIQRKRASWTSELGDTSEALIPNQMMYCKYQIGAVANWQFGLWEAITNYATIAKTEIMAEAERWVRIQCARLDKRLEIRLAMHSLRIEKIESYIYDVRLEELCLHQARFDEHKIAAENRINDLKEECTSYLTKFNEIFEIYDQNLKEIESSCVKLNSGGLVNGQKAIVKAKTEDCIEEIESLYAEYLLKCNGFFERVKVSHIKFTENMKLFFEGGNFSIPETKDYLRLQSKIESNVEKTLVGIRRDIEVGRVKITAKIENRNDEVLNMLQLVREEHQFQEEVRKKIISVKNELRSVVCHLSNEFKQVVDQYSTSKIKMLPNCGNYDYFDSFVEGFKDFVKKLEKLGNYLFHPNPVVLYSDKCAISEENSHYSHHSHKTDDYDLRTALFNFKINEEEDSYFMNLQKILSKGWDDIMANAQDRIGGFQNIVKFPRIKTEDVVIDFEGALQEIMKPVDPAVKKLIYTGSNKDGRLNYLHKRIQLLPEDRYYFPECASFEYGWKMWDHVKTIRKLGFGRQQVIKDSFYRKRGVDRDPDWYREPAHISPTFCNTCIS